MHWLKDVFIDIIVTITIVSAVLLEIEWMYWVITVYTGVLLLAKSVVFLADDALQLIRKTQNKAPEWFNHLLYGVNTAVLLFNEWWYLGAAWAIIWILSYLASRKLSATRPVSS